MRVRRSAAGRAVARARLALFLSIIALVLTVPSTPYAIEALWGDWSDSSLPQGWNWAFALWIVAPVFGVSSLIMARIALRTDDVATAGGTTTTWAKVIAWVAAVPWALTFLGAATVGL